MADLQAMEKALKNLSLGAMKQQTEKQPSLIELKFCVMGSKNEIRLPKNVRPVPGSL
jgi:hypothetical protein